MATHSNILVWRIPWTEDPGGATVHGLVGLHNLWGPKEPGHD